MLYIVWATTPMNNMRDQQRIRNNTQQATATCLANLAGFVDRWRDATPYMKVLEFLQQKIVWNTGIVNIQYGAPIVLEEAEVHLEQLRKSYLHRAVLGMIEDMMYRGLIDQDPLEDVSKR